MEPYFLDTMDATDVITTLVLIIGLVGIYWWVKKYAR